MKFSDAFARLSEGQLLKRSSTAQAIAHIRMVSPTAEPEVDGPKEVFVAMLGNRRVHRLPEYRTEAEGKADLAKRAKALKEGWKKFSEFQAKIDSGESIKDEDRVRRPSKSADYYASMDLQEVPVNRQVKISTPYLIAVYKDGTVQPYAMTDADLFGVDWEIA